MAVGGLAITSAVLHAVLLADGDAAGISVRGTTTCPTPEAVANRLGPMLPADAALPPSTWIELQDVPASRLGRRDIDVRLNADGGEAARAVRRVERSGTCSDMADAVAVVASGWVTRYEPVAPAAPSLPPWPADRADRRADVATPDARPQDRDADAPPFGVGLGTGVVTGSSGGVALSVQAEGEAHRGPWIFRLGATATTDRRLDVSSDASVSWRRALVAASVARSWTRSGTSIEMGLGAAAGGTWSSGSGAAVGGGPTRAAIAVAPSARLGQFVAALRGDVWIDLRANGWLTSDQAEANGDGGPSARLPRVDVLASVGFTFRFGRSERD